MTILAIFVFWQIRRLSTASFWVNHTSQVEVAMRTIQNDLIDMETGMRGYLLSGNPKFLAPYEKSKPELDRELSILSDLVADNPSHGVRLNGLRESIKTWEAYAIRRITQEGERPSSSFRHVGDDEGKSLMDGLRSRINASLSEEDKLMHERVTTSERMQGWLFSLVALATLGPGSVLAFFSKRQLQGLARVYEKALEAENKKAEELRDTQAQFSQLADAMPQLVWKAKPDGRLYWYNRRWYEYTGTTPQDMEGWGWQKVHDPSQLARVLRGWTTALATEKPFEMTFPLKGADGTFRWFLTRVLPVFDSHGKLTRWFGTNTDIDDFKKAQTALEESEERLSLATESAFIGTWSWHLKDNGLYWSNLMKSIFDFAEGEFPDNLEGFWQRVHPEDRVAVEKALEYSSFQRIPYDIEYRIIWKSGSIHWIAAKGHAFFDDDTGKATRMFGVAFDITDRKTSEEKLARTMDELRSSLRSRDEFLSIASHELKTLLTSLKIQNQALERDIRKGHERAYQPERIKGVVAQTTKQLSKLQRMIDDMLDIARIRSGTLILEKKRTDLCELVREVSERTKPLFLQAGAPLPEVQFCKEALGEWDKIRLEQVMHSLLRNAILYGNKKPVHIRVECDDAFCRIRIQDHGIGIAPENQKRIFNRFERAVDVNEVSGFGLGLFLVQQIVEAHGGTTSVESQLGLGSTFTVELPRHDRTSSANRVDVSKAS
jgi:PAS domain S-box-containing protein